MHRRVWLAGFVAGAASLVCSGVNANEPVAGLEIIDCHTHFYDPSRPEGVPWPGKDSSLYRTVLPEHLRALKQHRRVTGTVIVEASSRIEDNAWLLDLAEHDPFIVGIVGRLEPDSATFARDLQRFAANPLFRGIRVSSQLVRELLQRNAFDNLQLLATHDLALDVNGGPETPGTIAELASKLPELRIVLNHIGNVGITADPPPADWKAGIRAAAKHPRVFCKVSALVEGAARNGQTPPSDLEFYRPYLDIVWDAFGEDRVIYGSNWPVSERAADYAVLQRIAMGYAEEKGDAVLRKFCSQNAKLAYKWVERPGRN